VRLCTIRTVVAIIGLSTLLALFTPLAAGPQTVQAQAAMDCLDDPVESDDLTVFDVNVGDTFYVTVPTDPASDTGWGLFESGPPRALAGVAPATIPRQPGAAGPRKECWTFGAQAPGMVLLTFELRRISERFSGPPLRTRQIVLTVHESP